MIFNPVVVGSSDGSTSQDFIYVDYEYSQDDGDNLSFISHWTGGDIRLLDGAEVIMSIQRYDLGDATEADVAYEKTFTSGNGVLLTGTSRLGATETFYVETECLPGGSPLTIIDQFPTTNSGEIFISGLIYATIGDFGTRYFTCFRNDIITDEGEVVSNLYVEFTDSGDIFVYIAYGEFAEGEHKLTFVKEFPQ